MWERMIQLRTIIATILTLALSSAASWIITFKLGWLWSGFDDSASYILTLLAIGCVLVCIISPFLAVMNLLERAEKAQAGSTAIE